MKFPRGRWAFDMHTLLAFMVACCAMAWIVVIVIDAASPVMTWSRRLRNGDVEQRREAVEKLKEIDAGQVPTALPALVAALQDSDAEVATATALALGGAALAALEGGDRDSARQAVTALTAALRDDRPDVRASAAMGLAFADAHAGSLGTDEDQARSDALAGSLADDPDDGVRLAAASSLACVGVGGAGLRALIKARNDDHDGVRDMAAQAFESYRIGGDAATLALLGELRTSDPALLSLCSRLLNVNPSSESSRRSAVVVPRLIQALADSEPSIRSRAAGSLGSAGPDAEAAVPTLIGLMGEEDEAPKPEGEGANRSPFPWGPAAESATALGRIAPGTPREAEAAEALIAVLRESTNDLTRARAAEALTAFDAEFHEPAVPLLLSALRATKSPSASQWDPSDAFHSALGKMAPNTRWADEAVALLAAALDSALPGVRSTAAESLANFGPRAEPALARLHAIANDEREESWVRGSAGSAVRRIEAAIAETEAAPDATP